MPRFLTWAAPLLIVAAPALAQEAGKDAPAATAATAATTTATAAPAKPKKVCRTYQITGRRIAQTLCYTAEQWADIDRSRLDAANKLLRDVNGAAATAHFGGGGGSVDTSTLFGLGSPQ